MHTQASPETVLADLGKFPTGVICDALGRLGLAGFTDGIRPVRPATKMAGRARTVRFAANRAGATPGLNTYSVIRSLDPGDVMVIATDRCPAWIFGDNVATAALVQGLSGILTDACARDGAVLMEHPLPCFVAGLATRPPRAIEIVDTDVTVNFAGAQIRPYDFVVGDADGVVVIPADRVNDVLIQAADIEMLEGLQKSAIEAKASLPQLMEILAKKKVKK